MVEPQTQDPLAELARLIGETDPFSSASGYEEMLRQKTQTALMRRFGPEWRVVVLECLIPVEARTWKQHPGYINHRLDWRW